MPVWAKRASTSSTSSKIYGMRTRVDSTIWINDAHPAFARAMASRSLGYHTALTVALALAPLAVEARGKHAFITQFLAHWGSAPAATRATGRRRAKKISTSSVP